MTWDHAFVFLAVFVLDCAFARYVVEIARKRILNASALAAVIMTMNGYLAIAWVGTPSTIAAAAIGAAAGTAVTMRWLSQ